MLQTSNLKIEKKIFLASITSRRKRTSKNAMLKNSNCIINETLKKMLLFITSFRPRIRQQS